MTKRERIQNLMKPGRIYGYINKKGEQHLYLYSSIDQHYLKAVKDLDGKIIQNWRYVEFSTILKNAEKIF